MKKIFSLVGLLSLPCFLIAQPNLSIAGLSTDQTGFSPVPLAAGVFPQATVGSTVEVSYQARGFTAGDTIELLFQGTVLESRPLSAGAEEGTMSFSPNDVNLGNFVQLRVVSGSGTVASNFVPLQVSGFSTLQVGFPISGSVFGTGQTISLGLTGSAPGTGINRVTYLGEINGNAVSFGTANTAPFTQPLTFNAPGVVQIRALVLLQTGQEILTQTVRVSVREPANPVITLINPSPGASAIQGQTTVFRASSNVANTSVSRVEYLVNGEVVGGSDTAPYAVEYSFPGPGLWRVQARAILAGNEDAPFVSSTVTVQVRSAAAPTIRLVSPIPNQSFQAGETIRISAFTVVSESLLERIDFAVNGQVIGSATGFPLETEFSPVSDGTYQIEAILYDTGGNVVPAAPLTVFVTRPPALFSDIIFRGLTGRSLTAEQSTQLQESFLSGTLNPFTWVEEIVVGDDSRVFRDLLTAEYQGSLVWPRPDQMGELREQFLAETAETYFQRQGALFLDNFGDGGFPVAQANRDQQLAFIEALFRRKYGVDPSAVQRQRLFAVTFNLEGTAERTAIIEAIGDFFRDNVEVVSGGSRFTQILRIVNPPNDRVVQFAITANLIQGLLGITPTNAEVEQLASFPVRERVERLLNDQRFRDRGIQIPGRPANQPFAQSASIGGGWKQETWFGRFFDADFPWIFHDRHGWGFTQTAGANGFWFFFLDQGWLFSSRNFPASYFFRASDQSWLYYLPDSQAPRWFFNFRTSTWEGR